MVTKEDIDNASVKCAKELSSSKTEFTLASRSDYEQGVIDGFRVCGAWFLENIKDPLKTTEKDIEEYIVKNLNIFPTEAELIAAVKGFTKGLEFSSKNLL